MSSPAIYSLLKPKNSRICNAQNTIVPVSNILPWISGESDIGMLGVEVDIEILTEALTYVIVRHFGLVNTAAGIFD